MESVSVGRWKLISVGASQLRLFDLERDPREQSDVSDAQPEVVEALAQMLLAERSAAAQRVSPGELPEAVRENLRALGYSE